MQIEVSGHHVSVTPALRSYAMEKFEKIQRHFDRINDVHIILSVNKKFQQCAEAYVELPGKKVFANSESKDMYAAIDELSNKLNRQVVRYKEKLQRHHYAQ